MESYELKSRLPASGFRLSAFGFRLPATGYWLSLRASRFWFSNLPISENRKNFVSREAAKECSPRRKPWVTRRKVGEAPKGRKKILLRYSANV
jgi:hypothetical protein